MQPTRTTSLRWLRERLFGTWENAAATISLALGLLSLIASLFIFFVIPANAIPQFVVFRDLLFWIALIIIIVVIVGKYVRREATISDLRRQLASQQADPLTRPHAIAHAFRDELFRRYYRPEVQRAPLTEADETTLNHLCNTFTFQVRQSLLDYFTSRGMDVGDDLSVTVKLVITPDEVARHARDPQQQQKIRDTHDRPKWIITAYRDSVTYNMRKEREVGLKVFDIDKTTPFKIVVRDLEPAFVHDDLTSMGTGYQNENRDWRSQYNASLAVPIRYLSADQEKYRCYGLLAADSLNRKKYQPLFNTPECRNIMDYAADLLAVYFLTLEMTESKRSPDSGPVPDPARHKT